MPPMPPCRAGVLYHGFVVGSVVGGMVDGALDGISDRALCAKQRTADRCPATFCIITSWVL